VSRGRNAWRLGLALLIGAMASAAEPKPILTAGAQPLLVGKFLFNRYHVMQSFAFDPNNGELYAVQVEGLDALGTREQHGERGDLELTRLSADGNTVLGHMRLEGFGHGVSIGVEPVGASVYIWTEIDSVPNGADSGRGTRIGRFRFANGTTLVHDDPAITKYKPVPGTQMTPCLSLSERKVMVRYLTGKGDFRAALFRLDDLKAGGTPRPLHDIPLPGGLGTFQGYCTYGDNVFLFTGTAYTKANPPPGNAMLLVLDWNTGKVLEKAHTDIFGDQTHREPEGMAVRLTPAGQPQVCFGFASSCSPTDSRRIISIAWLPLPQITATP
jgi:hypothetical protein